MYEWGDLRYFLAVHREGTLIAAGRALRVDPTTVGRRIAALEGRLRAKLFVRSAAGWVPTPAGRQVLSAAERAEAAATEVERLAGASQLPAGRVRVTTIEIVASRILAPALPGLSERYPDLRVDLVCTAATLDLARGEADLALRVGRPTEPDLLARRLSTATSRPYAARRWLEARGLGPDLRDLGGCEVLLLMMPGRWAEDLGPVRPVLRSNELSVLHRACVAGLGVAMLPDLLAADHPDLVALDGVGRRQEDPLWLVMHRDMADVARVRAVADFLVETLAPEPA